MNRGIRLTVRLFPSVLIMAIIYYFSSQTGSELQGLFPFLDSFNWGHLVAYFVLALSYYWALSTYRMKYIYIVVIVLCLLYGVTDEWHQSFVPNRTPDIADLINDTIGASIAMFLVSRFRKFVTKR